MALTLTKGFLAGLNASRFIVVPGPALQPQAVACAQVHMIKVPCDAYVVPHYIEGRSRIGVSSMIEKAGAVAGLEAYDEFLAKCAEVRPGIGDCYITESGGGLSKYLAHVACMGATDGRKDAETVQYTTFSTLIEASGRGLDFIVFPPLGITPYGSLAADKAASIMLGSIFDFLGGSRMERPNQVLIALNGSDVAYQAFAAELASLAGPGSGVRHSIAPGAPGLPETYPMDKRRITSVIASLSEFQLATLCLALARSNGSMRSRCEDLPWFGKIEELFEGDGLRPFAIEEIRRLSDERGKASVPPRKPALGHGLKKP